MYPAFALHELRARALYCVCVLSGLVVGLFAGDRIFPSVQKAFGDPLADVAFGFTAFLLVALVSVRRLPESFESVESG